MNIKSVIIENFRGYKDRQVIDLNNFTAFVGRNDVGKSTILEALDIFFNDSKGVVVMDSTDVNREAKEANDKVDIVIGVEFINLPSEVCIDDNNTTTLSDEYLLNYEGNLTVIKKYTNGSKTPKVYIYAYHPNHKECCDLLSKKQKELQELSEDLDCDKTKNAEMRKAIRNLYSDFLDLRMKEIEVSKEDAKNIWDKLKQYMPIYTLFQADRSNDDKDKEVQDPLKEAVKIIMSSTKIRSKCQEIYDAVIEELQNVSDRTVKKISDMNPSLASSLHPALPTADDLKWTDVFKSVSITGENDIPINKRGSGVKRLILINFFRAEAENKQEKAKAPGIIYAIEEPETAQHAHHQKLLIDALKKLSQKDNIQVIITTHSSLILKQLAFDEVRIVKNIESGKVVNKISESQLPYPSLNEIAFTAFGDVLVEYHNELYGYIEFEGWKNEFKNGKELYPYKKETTKGIKEENLIKTEIIRHQIHHPENKLNTYFTPDELYNSINEMRSFIETYKAAKK